MKALHEFLQLIIYQIPYFCATVCIKFLEGFSLFKNKKAEIPVISA